MKPVVWFVAPTLSSAAETLIAGTLTGGITGERVSSVDQLLGAAQNPEAIIFVDEEALQALTACEHVPRAVVAVTTSTLPTPVGWLRDHVWLSHVMSASLLDHPLASMHILNVSSTLKERRPRVLDWIGSDVDGRRVLLTHARRRAERLEKMSAFLAERGVGARTIEQLCDAAEELLTNAFYDAPVAAGVITKPLSRETDVVLPEESACDLAYGAREDLAIVRVKDPFGSLSRRRLVEVLTRCARTDMQVEVDESMGGAGLGMWRIFSAATFVAVSVIKGVSTEILVGFGKRSNPKPFAFDLFFTDGHKPKAWVLASEDSVVGPGFSNSMLLELGSKSRGN